MYLINILAQMRAGGDLHHLGFGMGNYNDILMEKLGGIHRDKLLPEFASETFQTWADKLQAVADSDEWKAAMEANGLAPFTKVGGDFQSWVDDVVAQTVELSKEIGVIQ